MSRGRSHERVGGKGNMSRSKSKSNRRLCYHYKKKGNFRRDCPKMKRDGENKESSSNANAAMEQKSFDKEESSDVLL